MSQNCNFNLVNDVQNGASVGLPQLERIDEVIEGVEKRLERFDDVLNPGEENRSLAYDHRSLKIKTFSVE